MSVFASQFKDYASPNLQARHGEPVTHTDELGAATLITALVSDEFDGEMHGVDGMVRRRERFADFRTAGSGGGGGGDAGVANPKIGHTLTIGEVEYDIVDLSPSGSGWVTARCTRSDVQDGGVIAHPGHRIRRFS